MLDRTRRKHPGLFTGSSFAYGITKSNVSRLKAAIQRVQGASGDMLWMDVGDSTTAGTGSNTPAGNGLRTQSRSYVTAGLVATRLGVTVMRDNVFSSAGKSFANYVTYDTAVTQGSATFHATNAAPGGYIFNHALTTGPMRFTPASGAFDRIRVRWKGNTVGRDIVWTTSSGSTGSLVGDGSFAIKTTVLTCTSSTWVEFKSSVAGAVEWFGVETYNNTGSKIFLNNCGWGGSTSGTATDGWTQTTGGGTRPLLAIPHMAPDFTIINLNINDMFAGTSVATWKTNVQSIINAAITSGDVALMTSNPLNVAKYGSEAAQAPFFQGIRDLAAQNNLPCIDLKAFFGDWVTANANGYMSDNEHMLAAGYAAAAGVVDDFIRVVMTT